MKSRGRPWEQQGNSSPNSSFEQRPRSLHNQRPRYHNGPGRADNASFKGRQGGTVATNDLFAKLSDIFLALQN